MSDTTTRKPFTDITWAAGVHPLDYPAIEGRTVTGAHLNRCDAHGHATHLVNGADTGVCPRCGVVTEADQAEVELNRLHRELWALQWAVVEARLQSARQTTIATLTELYDVALTRWFYLEGHLHGSGPDDGPAEDLEPEPVPYVLTELALEV